MATPIPPHAKEVGARVDRFSDLVRQINALEVGGEMTAESRPGINHIPSQLHHAQKRYPGRKYIWALDGMDVQTRRKVIRIWRTA